VYNGVRAGCARAARVLLACTRVWSGGQRRRWLLVLGQHKEGRRRCASFFPPTGACPAKEPHATHPRPAPSTLINKSLGCFPSALSGFGDGVSRCSTLLNADGRGPCASTKNHARTESSRKKEGSTSRYTHTRAPRLHRSAYADAPRAERGCGRVRAAWGWSVEDALGHGKPWKEERRRAVDLLCFVCLWVMKGESFQALVVRPCSFLQAFIAHKYNARVGKCHRKGIEKGA